MKIKLDAQDIWREYEKGIAYNTSIDLYERVKRNENFYIGKQWEGLNAPDLPKPVINILKRVVNYFISMIHSDDVGVSFTPFIENQEEQIWANVWADEVENALEYAEIKRYARHAVKNAAVDGEGCLYFYFDPEAETGQEAKGRIVCEEIDNTNYIVENPHKWNIQTQGYIIVESRKTLSDVREEAKKNGVSEDEISLIMPDESEREYRFENARDDSLVTVLTKFWRENGEVKAIRTTKEVVIRKEWNTKYWRYPLAVMPWEEVKNSYHGMSAVSGFIPNQIAINQLWAMAIQHVKTHAFPQIIYDSTKITSWSNKIGRAIGVIGNPAEAVYVSTRNADMSGHVMDIIERLTQKTLEFMGANDVALGNVRPDNTSAIIATQKAAAMPLEIQRMAYYRFMEDCIRIITDIMRADYGVRTVEIVDTEGQESQAQMDFSKSTATYNMSVDVGAASYWSELMQVQTADNLFAKGIIGDAITYLESIPNHYVRGKAKIIDSLKKKQEAAAQTQQMPQMQPQMPEGGVLG